MSTYMTPQDRDLFYDIFFPLLDYVGRKNGKDLSFMDAVIAQRVDRQRAMELADALFDDVSIIDTYLEEDGASLSEEKKDILKSWKNFRRADFIVERYLQSGAALMELEDGGNVYMVMGLSNPLEDVFGGIKPVMTYTTLLPFKGKIISDGLYFTKNVSFGPGLVRRFKEMYKEAKNEGRIYKVMPKQDE